jgi:tRNA threonylcarbamoyladenosine biosynthesis protein TsaE
MLTRLFKLSDEVKTAAFGKQLAHTLTQQYMVRTSKLQVHLCGELGAGKTTLVRALLRALGFTGTVRSPSYTLVESYLINRPIHTPFYLYHFDLYRFTEPSEWVDAGFCEYLSACACCLIEWPEKAIDLLGTPDLVLTIEMLGAQRRLLAHALSQAGKELIAKC